MLQPILRFAVALLVVCSLAPEAKAASYGDFVDPTGTVQYLGVQDVNGLFGAPSVSLDSLDFTPSNFQAQCTQCPAGVTTADTLSFDIQAVSGRQLDTIRISEGLDYSLLSYDPVGFASATVTSVLTIEVVQVNGITVSGISAAFDVLYVPPGGRLGLVSVSGVQTQIGVILGDTGEIDIRAIMAGAGAVGEATRVRVSLGNTLTAFHDGSGGQASIRKRDADARSLTIIGTAIGAPEPTTAVLILGGLALLSGRRARP